MAMNEETQQQLQEITDLLVAAGYFRARIKTLPAFDKVVGGIVWCIENCNFDVDVDLLFQENLTIGQRIALTEKIVAVLALMKCPHRIEPHQIQGLDFKNIFNAVQWLVKKSLETRHERGAQIRSLSVSKFHRMFSDPESEANDLRSKQLIDAMNAYGVVRKFQRQGKHPEDEALSVESTLFEYSGRSLWAGPDVAKTEMQKVEELMGEMAIAEDTINNTLTAAAVENFLKNVEESKATSKVERSPDNLQRRKLLLERQKEALTTALAKSTEEKKEVEKKLQESTQKFNALLEAQDQLDAEAETFKNMQSNENKEIIMQLIEKVSKLESLKQEEVAFKQQCHEELEALQNKIKELQSNSGEREAPVPSEKLEAQKENLAALRLHLGKLNRSIASMQRQIDEVPARAELAQYQKRFLELYTQVADKHKETKQYYTLFNTLHDTHSYLKKELELLNSIQESYAQAMSSSSCKEQFLDQFKDIVERVRQNKSKIESKFNERKTKRDQLSQTLLHLVEQERRYVSAVKQLTSECRKNEDLLACIRSKGIQ